MNPCLKTNIHAQNSQNISNPNNSTSCQHLKEDELPDLINVNLQNVSQNNKENSSPCHVLTSHSKQKVKFSGLNQVYNISPKKLKKSHNTSSILQTEAIHKLHEAFKPIKKNTQLHYTHKSNTQSNEHTQSHCSEHENNIFQDDVIITKQEGPTIYRFHTLTLESCKNISPLMHIQEIEPQCTTKFNGIGSPLIGPLKSTHRISGHDNNCYLRAISFAISGNETYHSYVREAICNFITLFDYNLSPFSQDGEGEDYIATNKMRKSRMSATETEVLGTAKMLQKDVYTWYQGQWLCYSYFREPTTDTIYLDNTSGCHFYVVLHP